MAAHITVSWSDLRSASVALEASLPSPERARLDELADPADRGRRLVAAALLQAAVRAHHGWPKDRVVPVERTCPRCGQAHGRPAIAGGPHVSVAHAGVLVAVATCAEAPVGIDIERTARFDLAEAEARAWTQQEALLKSGLAGASAETMPLTPPLPGFVAAVAGRRPIVRIRPLHTELEPAH